MTDLPIAPAAVDLSDLEPELHAPLEDEPDDAFDAGDA